MCKEALIQKMMEAYADSDLVSSVYPVIASKVLEGLSPADAIAHAIDEHVTSMPCDFSRCITKDCAPKDCVDRSARLTVLQKYAAPFLLESLE